MEQLFDPNSLKVNDLRDELKRRRLNPIGIKSILLQRLSKVLADEGKTLEDFAKSLSEAKNPIQTPVKVSEPDIIPNEEVAAAAVPNANSAVHAEVEEVNPSSPTAYVEEHKERDCRSETVTPHQTELAEESPTAQNVDPNDAECKDAVEPQVSHENTDYPEESDIARERGGSEERETVSEKGRSSDRDRSAEREHSKERSRHRSRERNHSHERERSRGRDHSSDRDRRRTPLRRTREPSISIDDEVDGWEKKGNVFLDMYNSDISLVISPDGFSAKPLTDDGFSLMWAGARATCGLKRGKSYFEVKLVKELSVDNLESLVGGATHVLRVGWSKDKTGLALGEEADTYGYGGTGKKSTDGKFEDYGREFGEGDVVGAFLEITDSEAIMSFSVNGVTQGECFRISRSPICDDFALFPHVYVKNVEFVVNFGQENQDPWFPPSDGSDSWKLISGVPSEDWFRASLPPSSKSECEVIMMIGLPGAGKTVYANNLCKESPEKQYNVLGTNLILEKMKVTGLTRKRNYHGRWDALIDKANQCLNKIMSIACKRRRNYILDQTNVYPSAQRRKMRPFEGFQRRAIVIVPTDEEFKRRIDQRTKEEGKEVPEKAVLEMKANFEIPKSIAEDSSSVFDEVIFTELQRDEADKLVKEYNAEGKASRQSEKRHRTDSSGHRDYSAGRHGDHRDYHHRDHRSRFDSYSRSSGRGDYDRKSSRGRFEYRNDRGAGGDRGRFASRYRDEGRDFGNREAGRFGNSSRFDNDGDYRSRGRGSYGGGGFQRSPRGRGGNFGGTPFPPDRSYSGPQYDQYGSEKPRFNRVGYHEGGNGDACNDGYQRGNISGRGGIYGNYGGAGYGYYQTGERRRYDQVGDTSGGPPAKQPAIAEGQYRGGFQGDGGTYRGGFRGGRGAGSGADRGSSFSGSRSGSYAQTQGLTVRPSSSTFSGAYYEAYNQQVPQQALSKGNDDVSGGYPSTDFGRGDEYQKSQRGNVAFSGSGRPSRFSSAAPDELLKQDSTSSQAVTSRYRSNYAVSHGCESGKDNSNQQTRSRFGQGSSLAQNQGTYGGGSSNNQQSGGRQPPSTTLSVQDYIYGYNQSGRYQAGGVQSSPQKIQQSYSSSALSERRPSSPIQPSQGYGTDFVNQGLSRQQQKSSQQGGYSSTYGGGSGNYSRQQPQTGDPTQRYYKGYGDDQPNSNFNKSDQQQDYDRGTYSQRVSGSTNINAQKFQHGYGGDFQSGKTQMKHDQESRGGYYQGYGGGQGSGSSKSGQQQSYSGYGQQDGPTKCGSQFQQGYDAIGYNQRPSGHLKSAQQAQRYGGDTGSSSVGGYSQQSSASSKSDPRTYGYSAGVSYTSYGYDSTFTSGGNAASQIANTPVSAGAPAAASSAAPSLYASALSAASKSGNDAARAVTQGYASATPTQIPQASYGYGAGGYYSGVPAATGNWPFTANPPTGSGNGSSSQAHQGPVGGSSVGYGYSQR